LSPHSPPKQQLIKSLLNWYGVQIISKRVQNTIKIIKPFLKALDFFSITYLIYKNKKSPIQIIFRLY
jgi:hypothetical protein